MAILSSLVESMPTAGGSSRLPASCLISGNAAQ
jgi:hypothetical protein